MSYFNLKQSFYYGGETCACRIIPSSLFFYKTCEFSPKRANMFSSKLKSDGREYYCVEIRDNMSGYKKIVSFYEDGVNQDIIFKSWDSWVYIPKAYFNNSIPTFCLPVKMWNGKSYSYGLYSFPYEKHRYLGDIYGTYKYTSEAVAVLFGYVKYLYSNASDAKQSAEVVKGIYNISFRYITENEYKSLLYN